MYCGDDDLLHCGCCNKCWQCEAQVELAAARFWLSWKHLSRISTSFPTCLLVTDASLCLYFRAYWEIGASSGGLSSIHQESFPALHATVDGVSQKLSCRCVESSILQQCWRLQQAAWYPNRLVQPWQKTKKLTG